MVGLRAAAFEAAVTARPILPALKPALVPGLTGGMLGGMLLFVIGHYAPAVIADAQKRFAPPSLLACSTAA